MRWKLLGLTIGFGIAWLGLSRTAVAQYGGNMGAYGGNGGSFSSTLEEGIQRGFADVIRSAGEYNLLTGQGAVSWAEAVRLDAENRFRMVQGYFEARRLNREYQLSVNRIPDPESVLRYLETLRPKRLSWNDLGVSGDLRWPVYWMAPKFDAQRTQLERLFRERATKGVLSEAEQILVEDTVRSMILELRLEIEAMRPQRYERAKQFLVSVNYEAGLPVQ
jgi:hypothetical protein